LSHLFRSEHDEDNSKVPVIASAELSCATTTAIELCMNGVKQVIVVPLVQTSNDITTVTSAAFQSQCLPSSSPVIDHVQLERVPDDVRLLAQSCVQESLSASVSNFDRFSISSLVASGQTCASTTSCLIPPSLYSSFSRMPTTISPAELPQNPSVTPFPLRYENSNRAAVPSSVPYSFPSFSVVSSLSYSVLPVGGFSLALQSMCPVAMPTPLQQPYTFPQASNPVLQVEIQPPNVNCMQHLFAVPSSVSQAPWLSYNSWNMGVTTPSYSGNIVAVDTAANNSVHSGTTIVPPWLQSDEHISNYHNFLPSLRSAVAPNLPENQPIPQFANYFARKRGVLPQNSAPGLQINNHGGLIGHNYRMMQYDPQFTARWPDPSVSSNDMQMRYDLTNQTPPAPPVSTSPVQIRRQKPQISFINSFCRWTENRDKEMSRKKTVKKNSASNKTVHSVSSFLQQKVSSESDTGRQPSHPFAVSGIPTDLQVATSHTTSVVVTASPVAAITTNVSDTVSHPTAVIQSSVTAKFNSMKNLTADSLLFDIKSDVTTRSLSGDRNGSSLTSRELSRLLSVGGADDADDSSQTEVGSDTRYQSDASLDNGSSQLGDAFGDLDSLPADVMGETSESLSLLESFCDMFEKSDSARRRSAPVSCPIASDGPRSSLENCDQPSKETSASVNREYTERCLQFAKSLGKGQHYAEEMRLQRQDQAKKRRRRTRLTSLEVADDSNSSDSWHPDSQSESSNYQTPTSSPVPSTASSLSRSSDDFVVVTRQARQRQREIKRRKRKRSRSLHRTIYSSKSRKRVTTFRNWPLAVTQRCSVMLERLRMQGQQSVNVRLVDTLICCPQLSVSKPVQRIVSSDSEASAADMQPTVKVRTRVPRIRDSDSS